jgi:hypothetical protein
MGRSTRQVFEDHLRLAQERELELDLKRNADDTVLLTSFGVFGGMREAHRILRKHLPNARSEYVRKLVHGEIAFLEWTADAEGTYADDGVDTFLIRDGRIRVQTIHYTVKRKQGVRSAGAAERSRE